MLMALAALAILLVGLLSILFITVKELLLLGRELIVILSRNRDNLVAESILSEFPIGEEFIFTGDYLSHWELAHFAWDRGVSCQLDVPDQHGWDWLVQGLGYPTTRSGHTGKFHLKFRGKILEQGCFGHMGLCSYRIEVIEMLAVTPFLD